MDHQGEYRKKLTSADGVAAMFESGWSCVTDAAAAIPPAILEALGRRAEAGDVKDLTFHGLLDLMPNAMFAYPGIFTPVSWFSGKIAKAAANRGEADIMPCGAVPGLHTCGRLFDRGVPHGRGRLFQRRRHRVLYGGAV